MSKHFSQILIQPCKEDEKIMEKSMDVDGQIALSLINPSKCGVNNLDDAIAGRGIVLGVPKSGDNYNTSLFECNVNLLQEVSDTLSRNRERNDFDFSKHPSKVLNEQGIPLELRHQVAYLADTLQYIVNCTSWHGKGGYHAFDAIEIKNRLERCAAMSNIALGGE